MRYRATMILSILIFICFSKSKAQNTIDGVNIITEIKKDKKAEKANEITHSKIEVFIKDKLTKKIIPVFYIRIGKVGVFVSNTDGYSKFFVKPGKYDIAVTMYGYNEKRIKKIKITSRNNYKIEFELEQKLDVD